MSFRTVCGIVGGMGILAASVSGATESSFSWSNVQIGGGGFVSAVIASPVDKNLFYARTDVGGAYRWDESRSKWVSLMDWVDVSERGLLGIEAIAVDPTTSGTVYMVAGTSYWNYGRTAFLRSTDKGESWQVVYTWDSTGAKGGAVQDFKAHGNGMGRGNGEALAIDPGNSDIMFYGSKNKGLWKSTNNGTNWTHVAAFTTAAGYDTTWNGSGFSFVTFAPKSSKVLYAGFLREGSTSNGTFENVFTSTDGGATWSALPIPDALRSTAGGAKVRLMPQRAVISRDGNLLTVTFSDGAGPHTMAWSEGWGMIYDGFGRGAVLQYNVSTKMWSDVSPEDFIDDGSTGTSKYDVVNVSDTSYQYLAPYGGIAIDPANDSVMIVTTMGYRGAQFWKLDTTGKSWKDQWGTNVYRTTDGGKTWDASFRYYWMAGGYYPTTEQMNSNGIGWMFNSSIHWTGAVAIDPNNTDRVWITSGNGVFRCDNISDYDVIAAGTYDSTANYYYSTRTVNQRQVWKVFSQGIEETVPEEVVSIPGGPLISIIGDYDGFRHESVSKYPSERLQTNVNGTKVSLGSTRALAYAPLSGKLVKVADARSANPTTYTVVPLDPVQISSDSGKTWAVGTYSSIDTLYKKGNVAISADGSIIIWVPGEYKGTGGKYPAMLYSSSNWASISGIDGDYVVGDPVNANVFYAYNDSTGAFYKSTDKGTAFSAVGTPGASLFKKFRTVIGHEGDIWLPVGVTADDGTQSGALMRSTDGGATWSKVGGVSYCEAVGFGKAKTTGGYPAVYVFATIGGITGVFGSDDEGSTWTQINDDAHEYGGLANGEFVMGDWNTYGVVYMSTAGRGIAARVPSDWNMDSSSSTAAVKAPKVPASTASSLSATLRNGTLSLNISGNARARVVLYDLGGRIVFGGIFSASAEIPLGSRVTKSGAYYLRVSGSSGAVLNKRISIVH